MTTLIRVMTHGTALGAAVIGGSLFAFSSFVMPALARLDPAAGIRAMQQINAAAVTRSFIGVFLATAVACVGLAVIQPDRVRGAGAVLYVIGTFVLTMVVHVPRNDALATLDPTSVAAAAEWKHYVASWSSWNHVRTAAALLSAFVLEWSTREIRS